MIAFLVIGGVLTFEGIRWLQHHRLLVRHSLEVLVALDHTETALISAESGQRGFLVTGREEYLEPFAAGVSRLDTTVDQLANLIDDNPLQTARIPELRKLVDEKVGELRITIDARRNGGMEAAQAAVNQNVGKKTMDHVREVIGEMRDVESDLMGEREAVASASYRTGLWTSILTMLLALTLVAAVLYLIAHNRRRAEKAARIIQADRRRLRVIEKQLDMTIESAGVGTWHVDPKSMTLTCDKRFYELFGRPDEPLTFEQAADRPSPLRHQVSRRSSQRFGALD